MWCDLTTDQCTCKTGEEKRRIAELKGDVARLEAAKDEAFTMVDRTRENQDELHARIVDLEAEIADLKRHRETLALQIDMGRDPIRVAENERLRSVIDDWHLWRKSRADWELEEPSMAMRSLLDEAAEAVNGTQEPGPNS